MGGTMDWLDKVFAPESGTIGKMLQAGAEMSGYTSPTYAPENLPQPIEEIPKTPEIPPVEKMVEKAATTAVAKAQSKRAAIARSRSIYTSPLGIEEEADIAKKYLLGK